MTARETNGRFIAVQLCETHTIIFLDLFPAMKKFPACLFASLLYVNEVAAEGWRRGRARGGAGGDPDGRSESLDPEEG